MAQHKISGNDYLLLISPDGMTYSTIVCLTSNSITRSTNTIDANTKCGPDKLAGTQTNGVTFEGQIMLDPTGTTVSVDVLEDSWASKETIYWKMAPVSPVVGDITYTGTGFISKLDEVFAQDAPGTFSGEIGVYGTISKTVED
jgi:hypothetical protein